MTTVQPAPPPSGEPLRSRWRAGTIVKILVVMALFGGLALALFSGWQRIQEQEQQYQWQFDPWAVGASLAVMILASIWGAFSWFAVARAFGAPIKVLPALRIYSTSNLGKYLPGKVLHAFARVLFFQQHGVALPLATTVVVIDIVMYIAAGLLVMVVALPTIISSIKEVQVDGPAVVAVSAIGLAIGLALLHPAALNWSFRLAHRLMPSREFPPIEARYLTILMIFGLYVLLWGLYTAALFAGIQAVYPVSASTLPALGAIYALSYLAGLVMPLAPAGLGVREGLMAVLLSQVMPGPAALAASILVRVLQVVAEGLCAAVFSRV